MKSLFNKYQAYTVEAQNISDEFAAALRPLFYKYKGKYSTRELFVIASGELSSLAAEQVLRFGLDKRKEEIKNGTKP